MPPRCLRCALLGAILLAGCHAPVREEVDALLCKRAGDIVDPQFDALLGPKSSGATVQEPERAPGEAAGKDKGVPELPPPRPLKQPKVSLEEKLQVPPGVPGAEAPRITLPRLPPGGKLLTPEEQKKVDEAIQRYFPALPPIGPEFEPAPGPGGQPLTLADLQKLARANSPLLRQAAADIKAAEGVWVQAGLYPNPTAGLQGQTQGPGGGPIYGGYAGQTIKTGGKIKIAQAAAKKDLDNTRLAYRKAETDLAASVRSGYFAVLVAQESIRANRALVKLTDAVFDVMVRQLKGGEVATYEPMQLGVYAAQARAALITSRNAYTLAWKQLASSLGLPAMPPTQLAGRVDMPVPVYPYDQVLARVLSNHTDVLTAANGIDKARYNLRMAEVTPIPDVSLQAMIQEDASPPGPARPILTFSAGLTLPVWDLNQGNINQSRGALLRAVEEPHRVRNDLTARVADAFRRYSENLMLVQLYRTDILPKQVQAFRGAVKRHYGGEPEKAGVGAYADLVTAEQNLVAVIGPYLTLLGSMWQAVVDVASLMQTDDLFQGCERMPVAEIPDLEHLLKLPCCHPCNPLPAPGLRGASMNWPSAGFGQPAQGAAPPREMIPPPAGESPATPSAAPPTEQTELPRELPPVAPTGQVLLLPPPSGPVLERAPER
jgi:cobalt-zinc-cadmium efflux system outer membrane protein